MSGCLHNARVLVTHIQQGARKQLQDVCLHMGMQTSTVRHTVVKALGRLCADKDKCVYCSRSQEDIINLFHRCTFTATVEL
jgi:hypothetical protein